MKSSAESLLIRRVWLADGKENSPLRKADVLVRNGKIAAIEPEISGSAAANRIFDGRKHVLAPGFLDAHGHSDISLLARPDGFGKISQGVTTEISGNCGLSPFPLTDRNRDHLRQLYEPYGVPLKWNSFPEYRDELDRRNCRLRLAPLVGHNTLRAAVANYEPRPLTDAELQEAKELLDRELSAGALGLSFGLLYVPGKFATPGELVELLSVVAAHNAILTVHLRSEGNQLLESMDEIFDAARAARLQRVHLSHFKTAGRANWGKLDEAFDRIERARADIPSISFDRYCYTESLTQLSVILPGECADLPDREITMKLQNPEYAAKLETELATARNAEYFTGVRLANTTFGPDVKFIGKTIAELATQRRISPAHAVVELLTHNSSECTAAFRGMSEENMLRIMDRAECVAGTDESARPADFSVGVSHPRGFGGMVKFLRRQLDRHGSIEGAVRQLTGKTAELFALSDRGELETGRDADLVLFDPETVDSRADFTSPHTPADGIDLTVIQGNVVYQP